MWKHIKQILDVPVFVIGEILRYYLTVRGTDKDKRAEYRTKLLDRLEKAVPYIALWIIFEMIFGITYVINRLDCCL